MINRFQGKFKIIILSLIAIVIVLVSLNCLYSYWNNFQIKKYKEKNYSVQVIRNNLNAIESEVFHGLDLGVRAYRSTRNKKSLGFYYYALNKKDSLFNNLYKSIHYFNIPPAELRIVEDTVEKYVKFCTHLKILVENGNFREFDSLLLLDKGRYYWNGYDNFRTEVFNKLKNYKSQVDGETEEALSDNFLMQIVTIVIVVPLLIVMCIIMIRYENLLTQTLKEVQDKNIALEYYYDLLSHQIRSPICSLQGLINLMNTTTDKKDKAEILQRIKSLNDNLDTITRLTRNGVEEEVLTDDELYQ